MKFILDPCCGGKMMWFNKNHPNTIYLDNRIAEKGHIQNGWNPNHEIKPDQVGDFRKIFFPDKSFKLVVFDPPHIIRKKISSESIMHKKYGTLDKKDWKKTIRLGMAECWRVLDDYGVLIFKWQESNVKLKELYPLFPTEPLFGHKTSRNGLTHWLCFIKGA